jgi:FlaA1/EpsC-like NDP-sugar epimerase
LAANASKLVLISTDKAIRPANVYGATKRLAEMLVLDAAKRTGAAFSVVRFGNVLGSRGSVIPLFKRQIAAGGPVLVTHPDMERYFMTIPEAVHLVLQAAAMGRGGEAFLLDMGKQVRIVDLAQDLIRLSGLEPGRDIEIEFTGIRPGEKLREELWEDEKVYEKTDHPDIVRSSHEASVAGGDLPGAIAELKGLAMRGDTPGIIRRLQEAIPGASISEAPAPDITAIV